MDSKNTALLVEIPRALSSDEEAKVDTFMTVRKVNRQTALKFLLGRKMDVERAHLLLNNYNKTIIERHFENVTITDVVKELRTGKMYIPGSRDRNQAGIVVIDMTKHVPGQFTKDETVRLAFYMGQKATERPSTWVHGLTLIVNLSGFTWAQWDSALQNDILGLFTNNIPARIKNILLFEPPWWINALVKIVSPFLKQKMRDRLQICDAASLKNWIETDQIPESLGGTFSYDHEAFINRCIEDMGDDVFRKKLHLDEQGREISVLPIEDLTVVAPPSGPKMDVDPKVLEVLQKEREEAIQLIDKRLETLKQDSDRRPSRSLDPGDFIHLLRSRAARLSLDMSMFQTPQSNRDERKRAQSVVESPIAEVPGEDYSPDALTARIKRDIEADIAKRTGQPAPSTPKPVALSPVAVEVEPEVVEVPEISEKPRRRGRRGRLAPAVEAPIMSSFGPLTDKKPSPSPVTEDMEQETEDAVAEPIVQDVEEEEPVAEEKLVTRLSTMDFAEVPVVPSALSQESLELSSKPSKSSPRSSPFVQEELKPSPTFHEEVPEIVISSSGAEEEAKSEPKEELAAPKRRRRQRAGGASKDRRAFRLEGTEIPDINA